MNKTLLTLLSFFLLTSNATADFTRIEAGTGIWLNEAIGKSTYTNAGFTATDTVKENSQTNVYAWAYIKHPLPIVPNLRLEYVSVGTDGKATGTFKNFIAPTQVQTRIDLKQFDVIPYYNILDNTAWITLDVGLDIKVIDVSYSAENVTILGVANQAYSKNETIALPLLYLRTRFEVPATDFGIEADIKYIKYNSSSIYDGKIKIDYTLDFLAIEPAIEVGYRVQEYILDESDLDARVDMKFSGFYAGVMVRF